MTHYDRSWKGKVLGLRYLVGIRVDKSKFDVIVKITIFPPTRKMLKQEYACRVDFAAPRNLMCYRVIKKEHKSRGRPPSRLENLHQSEAREKMKLPKTFPLRHLEGNRRPTEKKLFKDFKHYFCGKPLLVMICADPSDPSLYFGIEDFPQASLEPPEWTLTVTQVFIPYGNYRVNPKNSMAKFQSECQSFKSTTLEGTYIMVVQISRHSPWTNKILQTGASIGDLKQVLSLDCPDCEDFPVLIFIKSFTSQSSFGNPPILNLIRLKRFINLAPLLNEKRPVDLRRCPFQNIEDDVQF
ncbi:hypothetical protein Tco_0366793 [Tanacetum coccineum]